MTIVQELIWRWRTDEQSRIAYASGDLEFQHAYGSHDFYADAIGGGVGYTDKVHHKIHKSNNARMYFASKIASAQAGDATAQVWVGKYYFSSNHGNYADVIEALKYFQRAAANDDGEALYIVGAYHGNGLAGKCGCWRVLTD